MPVSDEHSVFGFRWSTVAGFSATGFLLMLIALSTFPASGIAPGNRGVTVPIIVAGALMIAIGQLPILYSAGKGSRLSAAVDVLVMILIASAGSLSFLALNFR